MPRISCLHIFLKYSMLICIFTHCVNLQAQHCVDFYTDGSSANFPGIARTRVPELIALDKRIRDTIAGGFADNKACIISYGKNGENDAFWAGYNFKARAIKPCSLYYKSAANYPVLFKVIQKGEIAGYYSIEFTEKLNDGKLYRKLKSAIEHFDFNDVYADPECFDVTMKESISKNETGEVERHHSELTHTQAGTDGDVTWVSFLVKMDGRSNNIDRILFQFMYPSPWKPTYFVAKPVRGTNYLQAVMAVFRPEGIVALRPINGLMEFRKWYALTFRAKLATDSSGFIDVYINGRKVDPDPIYGSAEHYYNGPVMFQPLGKKQIRAQLGGYCYFKFDVQPDESWYHLIDNVCIKSDRQGMTAKDVLPDNLKETGNFFQKELNITGNILEKYSGKDNTDIYPNYKLSHLFDNVLNNLWGSANEQDTVLYAFAPHKTKAIRHYSISPGYRQSEGHTYEQGSRPEFPPAGWVLYGSNNKTDWKKLSEVTDCTFDSYQKKQIKLANNTKKYRYLQFVFNKQKNKPRFELAEIEIF